MFSDFILPLADLGDASPQGIKDTLLVIGFLVSLGIGIAGFLRKPQVIPQPLEVQEKQKFATAEGVRKLSERVESLERRFAEIPVLIAEGNADLQRAVSEAGEERAKAIHDRINPLSSQIAMQGGSLTEISRTVHDIAAQLRIPQPRKP